jgi:hypothetical protein
MQRGAHEEGRQDGRADRYQNRIEQQRAGDEKLAGAMAGGKELDKGGNRRPCHPDTGEQFGAYLIDRVLGQQLVERKGDRCDQHPRRTDGDVMSFQ